jgi:hypothetical protein
MWILEKWQWQNHCWSNKQLPYKTVNMGLNNPLTNTGNDSKLIYLDLPPLPNKLQKDLIQHGLEIKNNIQGKDWLERFHNNQVNTISHVWESVATLNQSLQDQINDLYRPYLRQQFQGILGKLSNVLAQGKARCPPHCDRHRRTAINYILSSGGNSVATNFYHEKRNEENLVEAANKQYNEVTLDFAVQLPTNTWHAYDVQSYHSVEEIENTRLVFSLLLDSNLDFASFKSHYSNLIAK